jgi:hypothetical protein
LKEWGREYQEEYLINVRNLKNTLVLQLTYITYSKEGHVHFFFFQPGDDDGLITDKHCATLDVSK